MPITECVVGFLCDENEGTVLLIEKQRPAWQKQRLNGVGGHIEPGETPLAAMRREFQEETGLDVSGWELAVEMTGGTWKVYFFVSIGSMVGAVTQTDEELWTAPIRSLSLSVLPNLRWLIPLCLDSDIKKPVRVYDTTEPAAVTQDP